VKYEHTTPSQTQLIELKKIIEEIKIKAMGVYRKLNGSKSR